MQFGDDWPGIFVRGDDAFAFAMFLEDIARELAKAGSRSLASMQLRGLIEMFKSSDIRKNPSCQKAELVTDSKVMKPVENAITSIACGMCNGHGGLTPGTACPRCKGTGQEP